MTSRQAEPSGSVDRYAPALRLVELGLALSDARGGLTLDDMARIANVSRRTAERMRDKLASLAGGLDERLDDDGRKRWSMPAARMAAFAGPSVEELTELRRAIARLERDGAAREATALGRLLLKLEAMTPRAALRRMEPDVEALASAAGFGLRPGPREAIGPGIFEALQRAVLEMRTVRLRYRRRDTGAISRPILHPHGFLWGPRRYLVATNPHLKVNQARTYVLANIEAVALLDEPFAPDPAFDLPAFVDRSFGVFWDGRAFDVAWRFAPSAAADARAFLFHATQTLEDEPDGSLLVRFRASGLDEMAWHLFTWGDAVRVVEPPELAARYRALLESARRAAGNGEEAEA